MCVEQGSVLSPILSTLYISSIFHIFERRSKNLTILVLFLSFIDNGLLISQEKSFEKTNALLYCSYNIISSLFNQFDLVIEYGKSKIFHFSRFHRIFNSPSLNLSLLGGPILHPKMFRDTSALFLTGSYFSATHQLLFQ